MIALDTNIIVYATSLVDSLGRHVAARKLIHRLTPVGAILPVTHHIPGQSFGARPGIARQF